jgi:L-aspartate oxidase
VQFHPTGLAVDLDPLPLLSEALRGEGAALVNDAGERFMVAEHVEAELAPRDIVARGIWKRLARATGASTRARSATAPGRFRASSPPGGQDRPADRDASRAGGTIMGGVDVTLGRSTAGLWRAAISSTGVHGANRDVELSLEALVFGARVAKSALAAELPVPHDRSTRPLTRERRARMRRELRAPP